MKPAARLLAIPQPPPNRGKLLDAAGVQAMFAVHPPSLDWIWVHVPHKIKIGRRSYWYELDVKAWLEELRNHEAA